MNMKNVRRAALGGAAGLTLAAGLVWGSINPVQSLFAQSDTLDQEQGTIFEMRGGRGGHGGHGMRGDSMGGSALLANALGVTPVALQEANEAAQNALIDQAAAAGVITAEQATALKEDQRPTGDVSALRTYLADVDKDAALATALGITPEALAAAKDNQIAQGVEAGLITQEQANQMLLRQKIQDATQAAVEQAINEAVSEGLITQEEADAMQNGRGFGDHGMMRGRSGFGQSGFGQDGPGRSGIGRGGNGLFGAPDAPALDTPATTPASNNPDLDNA